MSKLLQFCLMCVAGASASAPAAAPIEIKLAPEVELSNAPAGTQPKTAPPPSSGSAKLREQDAAAQRIALSQIEDLYRKGLISREVFEERTRPKKLSFEEKLQRLKSLREQGLISEGVYEAQQKELLDANL